MAVAEPNTELHDELLHAVIADYLDGLEAGRPDDRGELLARHPELAAELDEFFAGQDSMAQLAVPLRAVLPDDPTARRVDTLVNGVLGDFRILREVGRGGMGVVYEAEQVSLGRRVALKVLPFAATMDPKHLQRFHNEARAAASLHHEHIVPVHGVGCERGVHYYAMQFIEGQTLAQLIPTLHAPPADADAPTVPVAALTTERSKPKGRELYRRIAELIADAADALEYAHSTGVVHRDVKPGNLMVDAAGKLWVTDFGLARFGGDGGLTMSGDMIGTLRYMSPEQALAKHGLVDHRTDVYSLGATLYEMVTGRVAVDGADKQEILNRIAFEEPVALRTLDNAIPVELETITLKALAKDPNDRYVTVGDFAADLGRFLADAPIKARAPTRRQRVAKWARRHKAALSSTVAACIAFLLVSVIALSISNFLITKERDDKSLALKEKEEALALAKANSIRAGRSFLNARRTVNRMTGMVNSTDKEWASLPVALRQRLATHALEFYEEFVHEGHTDPELRHEMGCAFWNIGDVQARRFRNWSEAERAFRQAIAVFESLVAEHPTRAMYRGHLGTSQRELGRVLAANGRLEEAERYMRLSVDNHDICLSEYQGFDPSGWVTAHVELVKFLVGNDRAREAESSFQRCMTFMELRSDRLDPTSYAYIFDACSSIGDIFYRKDLLQHAETAYSRAIKLKPDSPSAHQRLGVVFWVQRRYPEAEIVFARVVQINSLKPFSYYNLGWNLEFQGRFEGAIAAYHRAHDEASKKTGGLDSRTTNSQIDHGERMLKIAPKLSALLSGETKPANVDECLALALICRRNKNQLLAAFEHYSDAFAIDPKLTEQLSMHRYNATCAAALAGCGYGQDANKPDEAKRERLRRQALDWLIAELTAWSKLADKPAEHARIKQAMLHWQKDSDFAGVSAADALVKLPAAERVAWEKLWADVARLLNSIEEPKAAEEPPPEP